MYHLQIFHALFPYVGPCSRTTLDCAKCTGLQIMLARTRAKRQGKRRKRYIFYIFSSTYPLPLRSINLSRFLFSYARSTIFIVNKVCIWKCTQRVYWSMKWSPTIKVNSERSCKSRTWKEARVRGRRKVTVFPIPHCWHGEQWKQWNHSVLNRKTDCCTG